jgi:tetratricopeptide (TPR) repeat protein
LWGKVPLAARHALTACEKGRHFTAMAITVEQHLSRAMQAQQQGRRTEAIREVEAALRLRPDHPVAHNILGMDALGRNDTAAAKMHFEAATSADPGAAALWLNLAKAHRQSGDDEAERAALERALETDQRNLMAHIRLAELHERRVEMGEATTHWSAVAQLAREHASPPPELRTIFDHARAFLAERKGKLADALAAALADDLATASERDRRRITAANDVMLGRRKIYTNECFGMHYPFLPADEFFDREHFPWLPDLEAQTEVIRGEVIELMKSGDAGLSPYVAMPPGTPRNKWTELNNSAAWSALHLWKDGERIEEACSRARSRW